jgi:hypothetical protein
MTGWIELEGDAGRNAVVLDPDGNSRVATQPKSDGPNTARGPDGRPTTAMT